MVTRLITCSDIAQTVHRQAVRDVTVRDGHDGPLETELFSLPDNNNAYSQRPVNVHEPSETNKEWTKVHWECLSHLRHQRARNIIMYLIYFKMS